MKLSEHFHPILTIYLSKERYVLHFEKLQGLDRSQNLVRTSPKYLNRSQNIVRTSSGVLIWSGDPVYIGLAKAD